jgi:hypothetical protein
MAGSASCGDSRNPARCPGCASSRSTTGS